MGSLRTVVLAMCVFVSLVGGADAQPALGPFSWQLQPFCNVITLTATPSGSVFALEGFDDQCGAATRASASGIAFLNPDSTIGLGIVIVSTPGATPVFVDATVSLATGSGTWRDNQEASGRFELGQSTGGSARPLLVSTLNLTGAISQLPTLRLRKSLGTVEAPMPVTSGLNLGGLTAMGWDGSAYAVGAFTAATVAENWTPSAHGANFSIWTVAAGGIAPMPRMTINHDGRVGIGTFAPQDTLHVAGEARVASCIKNTGGGTIAGVCASDRRLKRQIVSLAPALERVTELRPVRFAWRADEFPERGFGDQQEMGLVAQEVEQTIPALVSTDAEGFKAVNYSALPILAIQAIKELKEKNDALERRLAALEASGRYERK